MDMFSSSVALFICHKARTNKQMHFTVFSYFFALWSHNNFYELQLKYEGLVFDAPNWAIPFKKTLKLRIRKKHYRIPYNCSKYKQ